MLIMINWIVNFAVNHNVLIYAAIIILAFFQGPLLAVIFGILLRLGYLHLIPVYVALMAGDLLGDAIWYEVGRHFGQKFIGKYGKYVGLTQKKIDMVTKLFHKYKNIVLFVSKITNGFGFAIVTLFTAGMAKVPFGSYMAINLLGQFIWTGIMISAGYFFSSAYIQLDNWGGRISLTATILVVLFLLYRYWKYVRQQVEDAGV